MPNKTTDALAGGRVVFLTDGELDWYGDDYAVERQAWAPLGVTAASYGCRDENDVMAAVQEADVVVSISVRVPLTARVIATLERCRCIVRAGVGTDNVDLAAATEAGILVANVPDYCTADVADHTVALILALARRIPFLDRFVRSGGWQYSVQFTGPVPRLATLSLGLVGFGRVARAVASRMQGWVRMILASDPYVEQREALSYGVPLVSLEALLQTADIISLHLPLLPTTHRLIGAAELARIKPSAVLVNTSRGGVLDEVALACALREGRLAGAGLDVLDDEPLSPDNPLASLDNVILTPHFAGYSEAAKRDLRESVARSVSLILQRSWPPHVVNPTTVPRFSLEGGPEE
jgi:D-3-phosphoglycerate dehydrogenase